MKSKVVEFVDRSFIGKGLFFFLAKNVALLRNIFVNLVFVKESWRINYLRGIVDVVILLKLLK